MESEVQNNNTESQQDLETEFGDSSSDKKDDNKADDNVESSSTGSDGGKGGGSGSGGGYSADCSSSDNSSLEAVKGGVPDKEMARLTVNGDRKSIPESASKESKSKSNKNSTQKAQKGLRRGTDQSEAGGSSALQSQQMESDVDSQWNIETNDALHKESLLPQWNGVRVRHPMDPRIDISTVGIHHAALPATDLPENSQSQSEEKDSAGDNPSRESSDPPPPPSIDQYMKLMEVVRPFFHAHGISHDGMEHATKSDDYYLSNERPSSDFATEPSDSDQKRSGSKLKVPVATWKAAHPASAAPTGAAAAAASYPPARRRDPHESDSSSMVVLARVKKKHLKRADEDSGNDGSNNSTNHSSNSSSSSDRRVAVQQQPERREEIDPPNGEAGSANEDDSNDNSGEADDSAGPQAGQQESTSASSSEGRNNQEGEAAPRRYGVPAVVSEYSSSRTGSSGASNNNMMSTSGSGSGGNTGSGTGSGTASGSNQGSGNDQGISSNGIGSSGSGNDVKGSSEETMENSGENNSGENSGGNSDSSKNNRKEKKAGNVPADVPHVSSSHRHTSNPPDTTCRDTAVQPQQKKPRHDKAKNAVREKKLQDKKRKRMNMRREYEEKIKDLESSESSRDRGETGIKPGRPITLDKVLSFTKIPRIVIKEGPPFLVVYTNAAYCRLTGVDSHVAVGKPISSLLSIPEGELVADTAGNAGSAPSQNPATGTAKEPGDGMDVDQNNNQIIPDGAHNTGGGNAFSAEDVTNRARPASQHENTEMCLERLVAASGFGRCHVINARTRSRPMIGRNVSITKPSSVASTRNREELGFGSAFATSGHEWSHPNMLPCSMSVSPVVSSPEAFDVAAVVTDKDQSESHHHKTKRRKHHHHNDTQPAGGHHQPRRNHVLREVSMHRRRHLITHFVIQLEPFEGGGFRQNRAADSHSSTTSTTVEANILGLTKSELRRQRLRASHANSHIDEINRQHAGDDNDEMESESTDAKEPVTAIG